MDGIVKAQRIYDHMEPKVAADTFEERMAVIEESLSAYDLIDDFFVAQEPFLQALKSRNAELIGRLCLAIYDAHLASVFDYQTGMERNAALAPDVVAANVLRTV